MTTYNKLIRDRIPDMLEKAGTKFHVEVLNQDRYILELKKKLSEEIIEYQEAADDNMALEELADLLEVIHALAPIHGSTINEVEQIRMSKMEEEGSYDGKIYLTDVENEV